MSDSLSVVIWWLMIFVMGTIFLPVTTSIFHRFIDRGYIFTKVVGILISSYLMWFLGSLHVLPFTRLTLIVILLGFSLLSMFIFSKKKEKSGNALPWRLMIFEEILFFTTLACWSYVRATEPSIRSLEKFMDFGFVNSILRSPYFPPADMWLAKSPDFSGGYFINYYYFGHYIAAFLTKLSGIDPAITYNLMIATLFAFTFTLPFSLGMNLYYLFSYISSIKDQISKIYIKLIIVGLLTAFIVSLGGNLHTLYVFTSGYPNESPQPPWQLELGIHPEKYWYPNATRFIPFTIHEFPIYSFVVADLHGHVSDIPLVMLTLAILLVLITSHPNISNLRDLGNLRKMMAEFENHTSIALLPLIFLGILLATMYMTNAWDGLIYMILSGLVFLYINLNKVILVSAAHPGSQGNSGQARMTILTALYKTFSACLFLLFFFLLSSLPFSLNFKPFVSGIGILCAPAFLLGKSLGPLLFETGKCQKSPFYQLAILWGFFYFNVIVYLVFVILPRIKFWGQRHPEPRLNRGEGSSERSERKYAAFRPRFFSASWRIRMTNWPARFFCKILELPPVDIFILLLIFISTLLLIFPEFFYVKDIYPAHYRANTMFKLGYQAFMMLGIASAYIFMRIKSLARDPSTEFTLKNFSRNFSVLGMTMRVIFNVFFIILFFLIAIYPQFAINSFYGNLQTYRGLYGLNWMRDQYPDDYNAVEWIRKNISGQPVIAEANGDSYTDYDRVSANTGLPTIIGWPVHEWLWRGSYDEAGKRIPEVTAIYESKDIAKTKEILKKYNVEYIFVGQLERDKYKNLEEEKIKSLGKVVFGSRKTKVYKIVL